MGIAHYESVCFADQKKRIVLPGARPGDAYQVRETEPGYLEVTRLVPQASALKQPTDDLDARWIEFALTPRCSWEDLRKETREDI